MSRKLTNTHIMVKDQDALTQWTSAPTNVRNFDSLSIHIGAGGAIDNSFQLQARNVENPVNPEEGWYDLVFGQAPVLEQETQILLTELPFVEIRLTIGAGTLAAAYSVRMVSKTKGA